MSTRGVTLGLLPDTCLTEHRVHDDGETKVLLVVGSLLPMGDNGQQLPDCLSRKTTICSRLGVLIVSCVIHS
jgi:hypothetical protein